MVVHEYVSVNWLIPEKHANHKTIQVNASTTDLNQ